MIVRGSCFIQSCYVGFRFLRFKYSPWLTLAIAPFNLLFSSGIQRTYEKIRCMSALSKIDVAGVCELINDLLW
jgi:hypothetical protein